MSEEKTTDAREEQPMNEENRGGVESNVKAVKFQEFLMDNDINVFATESIDDEAETVMFRSRVEANGQRLPCAVIIDKSIFTIIRTQIIAGLKKEKQHRVKDYINELNGRYKFFKYYVREDGTVYLDLCLPFPDDNIDGKAIQLALGVLIRHLEDEYDKFMEKVWSKEDNAE